MNTKDLMLGDIVSFKECVGTKERVLPIVIKELHDYDNQILVSIDGDEAYDELELDEELVPIPITTDFLKNNGFERYKTNTRDEWVLSDDYYDIMMYEWSDSIWVFRYDSTEMNCPHEQHTMSYVHELQNALRLCGIEKEIVL